MRDAGTHIMKLPRKARERPEWQAAAEALIMAAEGRGPMLHARVGMLRAMGAPKEVRKKRAKTYRIYR